MCRDFREACILTQHDLQCFGMRLDLMPHAAAAAAVFHDNDNTSEDTIPCQHEGQYIQ